MQQVFGLISGIDSGKLIEATVNAKKAPIRSLQRRGAGVNAQISELGKIISKMSDLKTTLEDLQDNKDILALKATSGDEDILSVTADGDASPGTYDINVTELAAAEKNRSTTFADKYDAVKAGTITISVDGDDAVDITVDEGEDLKSVVDKINSADIDVHASLIFDGTNYSLQVVSGATGYTTANADDAITISENYTGATGQELGLTQISQAKNAAFTVDGLAITSQDNSVDGVLAGITLELTTLGQTTLTVDKDKEATKENITKFVDAYNEVMGLIKGQMTVSEGQDRSKKLAGEPFLGRLKSDLQQLVTEEVDGLSGTFESLAMIGITTGSDSKLSIDTEELDDALDKDINGVGNVFSFDETGISEALLAVVDRYVDGDEAILTERKEAFTKRIDSFNKRIERLEDRIEATKQQMIKRFTTLEQTMSTLNSQSNALLGLVTGGAAAAG